MFIHWQVILYVVIIDFLGLVSPGPDFFMVLKNSMCKSRKAGIYTAFGIGVGCAILFTLSIFGVGEIIAKNKFLFTILKICGALYLLYLSYKSFISKNHVDESLLLSTGKSEIKLANYFKIGLFCNLTNPKALMFIIAVSTYLVDHGYIYTDGIIVILLTAIATVIWFSLVALVFGSEKVRKIFYNYQRIINIIFGLVLLYIASRIMFI